MGNMQLLLTLCVGLAATLSSLDAAPVGTFNLHKSAPHKLVGDIWKQCNNTSDPVKINDVAVFPDPPKRGQNVTTNFNITLSKTITGGNVTIRLKYGILTIFNVTYELCKELTATHNKDRCPLNPGTHVIVASIPVPPKAFKGHYVGSVMGKDQSGKELFCITMDFHI